MNIQLSTLILACAVASATAALGCSSESNSAAPLASVPNDGGFDAEGNKALAWECDTSHNGWERCTDNRVEYCHIVSGMDPHFHWGADCVSLGLACVDVDDKGNAACVDSSKSCTPVDQKCDQNAAYFCVNGKLAQEPCGTAKECHADEGIPHCEDKGTECGGHGHLDAGTCHCDTGYVVDPADAKNCASAVEFPLQSCDLFRATPANESVVSTFADFPKAHADLDKPYTVTLPDNAPSYVHFPVQATGEYVLFLSDPSRFDAFMHRSGSNVSPPASGGVPNGMCSDLIKDHWHASLTFDGAATDTKVPYVVRFKAVPGGGPVSFMIRAEGE